jgi:hypothetical protein
LTRTPALAKAVPDTSRGESSRDWCQAGRLGSWPFFRAGNACVTSGSISRIATFRPMTVSGSIWDNRPTSYSSQSAPIRDLSSSGRPWRQRTSPTRRSESPPPELFPGSEGSPWTSIGLSLSASTRGCGTGGKRGVGAPNRDS